MTNQLATEIAPGSPLGTVLSTDPTDSQLQEKRAHMPTLPALRHQQSELRDKLRVGFHDREELLLWSHAAAAVSAGQLPDDWFASIVNDKWRLAACLNRPIEVREALLPKAAPSDSEARSIREDIVQDTLSPAYQTALRVLERQSSDFTEEREGVNHVDRQKFLALRPRLHQYATMQHKALLWALGHGDYPAIASREVAGEWADYVGYTCAGRGERVFSRRVTTPLGEWYGALIDDTQAYLVTLLADEILPLQNRTLRFAALEAEELPAQTHLDDTGGNIS